MHSIAYSACILEDPQDLPHSNSRLIISSLDTEAERRLLLLCDLAGIMDTDGRVALLGSIPPLYLGLLVITVYLATARLRQFYRLSHFKGPATTGISWWWHSKAVLSGQAHRFYGDVTEKYGRPTAS